MRRWAGSMSERRRWFRVIVTRRERSHETISISPGCRGVTIESIFLGRFWLLFGLGAGFVRLICSAVFFGDLLVLWMQLGYPLAFFLFLLRVSFRWVNVALGFGLCWFSNCNPRHNHGFGLSRFVLLAVRLPLRGRHGRRCRRDWLLSSSWLAGNHGFRLTAFMLTANDRRRLDWTNCRA